MKILYKEKGQVIIIVALLMIALLAVSGFVVDVGFLYLQRSRIRNACDAAALAAARDLPNSSTAISTAQQYASANGIPASNITITTPYSGDSNKIEIVIAHRVPLYFMRVIGYTSSVVRTRCVGTNFSSGGGDWIPLVVPDTASSNCRLWAPSNQCIDIAPSKGGQGWLGSQHKGIVNWLSCSESASVSSSTDCTPFTPATNYGNKPKNIENWTINGCNCGIYVGNDIGLYSGDTGANMGGPLKTKCNAQGLSDSGGSYGIFRVLVYDQIFSGPYVNIVGWASYKVYCNNISSSSAAGTFLEYYTNLPDKTQIPEKSASPGLYE